MVFTILDRFLGGVPSHSTKERFWSLDGHLQNEGFSKKEASNISWLINYRMMGELGGAGIGLGLVAFGDKTITQWCVR
jgi:hypothetical protein